LRPGFVNAQTQLLLTHLQTDAEPGIDLVTISDGFYPLGIAEAVESFATANIDDRLSEDQIGRTLQSVKRRRRSNTRRTIAKTVEVQAGDVSIKTRSSAFGEVLSQLTRIAIHDVTLLLVGETGTGKSTVARLIHELSSRRDRPFHTVACGALPRDLIESELFGHVRGAFTGAERTKIGRFEAAGQGTLLLDEIDVLGPKEQAKLLRVIETSEYELVGSTETQMSKARLIAASNVDLKTMMQNMEFRSDLYYRLNVLEFQLPLLHTRSEDIVPMALQFIEECCSEHGIRIDRVHIDFLDALKKYRWPGNVRELKNQVQRSVLFCDDRSLKVNDLSPMILKAQFDAIEERLNESDATSLADRVACNEQQILEEALRQNGNNRTATAKSLGISRVGLYKKMRKYGMLEGSLGKNGRAAR
jgi:transcriptional regulator with PAS, ATPase and Fis domain